MNMHIPLTALTLASVAVKTSIVSPESHLAPKSEIYFSRAKLQSSSRKSNNEILAFQKTLPRVAPPLPPVGSRSKRLLYQEQEPILENGILSNLYPRACFYRESKHVTHHQPLLEKKFKRSENEQKILSVSDKRPNKASKELVMDITMPIQTQKSVIQISQQFPQEIEPFQENSLQNSLSPQSYWYESSKHVTQTLSPLEAKLKVAEQQRAILNFADKGLKFVAITQPIWGNFDKLNCGLPTFINSALSGMAKMFLFFKAQSAVSKHLKIKIEQVEQFKAEAMNNINS